MKYLHRTIIGTCLLFTVSAVQAQSQGWQFGIGSGFYGINFDGNAGFESNLVGTIEGDFRLTTGDTTDLLESAFGLHRLS